MTLRREWLETEEWVRMEMQMYGYGKPLLLPEDELHSFKSALLKRIGSYVRVVNRPMLNDPKVRTLWWAWLHLDEDQKEFIRGCDLDNIIGRAHQLLASHPIEIQHMLKPRSCTTYWSTAKWVEAVHGQTPRCIVPLGKLIAQLFYEMHSDPKYARHNNLAMQYLGDVDDVMAYVGDSGIEVISHTPERLILKTPNGNAQVLREQWLWFNGLEFRHGNAKTLQLARMSYPDQSEAPGWWYKPTKMLEQDAIMTTNLCPELAA